MIYPFTHTPAHLQARYLRRQNIGWSNSPPHATTKFIAPVTGPLDPLNGQSLLVLADIENLSYSANNQLGLEICYEAITNRLTQSSEICELHAFFSVPPEGNRHRRADFEEQGWIVHNRRTEIIKTYTGERKRANIDNLLLFQAGILISRSTATTVVIASGDGDLVCDLAQDLSTLSIPKRVVTLSLAGSTSQRLDAQENRYIYANIEVGRDCMRLLTGSKRKPTHPL